MKKIDNSILTCYYNESVEKLLHKIHFFLQEYSTVLKPINGRNDMIKSIFSSNNYEFYPTKKKTTVFYDRESDIFIKILHPLKLKEKLKSKFINPSKKIYLLSEYLNKAGIKIPKILAYGKIKKGNLPFFLMKRIEGFQLKTILIREKRELPKNVYFDIIKNIADLHKMGYWFRDLHLAQIYVNDSKLTGFIDIDSIRKNLFFKIRHQAKDLAGLNHPELDITKKEKEELLDYYMNLMGINCKNKFISYIKKYSNLRWRKIPL